MVQKQLQSFLRFIKKNNYYNILNEHIKKDRFLKQGLKNKMFYDNKIQVIDLLYWLNIHYMKYHHILRDYSKYDETVLHKLRIKCKKCKKFSTKKEHLESIIKLME